MTKRVMKQTSFLALISAASLAAGPAFALTDEQVAGINSGALELVQQCSVAPASVAENTRLLALKYASDAREAPEIAGALISAVQTTSESPDCLFSVGQGITKFALSYGDANPTAVSIGTTIGQLGKISVVNACVNTAGLGTVVGVACGQTTSDVLHGGTRSGSLFGSFFGGGKDASHLSDNQVAAINSGALDIVNNFALDPDKVPEQARLLAAYNTNDPSQAAEVTGAILSAVQKVSDNPSGLFAVGEGVTRFAMSYGDTNPTAVAIGTTIGQIGKVPVINACVNTAGVGTQIGLACDPPTSDILQGRSNDSTSFGSSGENPNQDDPSPH